MRQDDRCCRKNCPTKRNRHRVVVPFLACDLACFATDAHSWIGEEPYLNVIAHVGVAALICAVCAFADHGTIGVVE